MSKDHKEVNAEEAMQKAAAESAPVVEAAPAQEAAPAE